MLQQGAVIYSPAAAWALRLEHTTDEELDYLSEINFFALDHADLVVALAPPGVPSVGVPIEVYHVLTLNDATRVALWFGDCDRIGAMWTHLIAAYPNRVYVLPGVFDRADVQSMLDWARNQKLEVA